MPENPFGLLVCLKLCVYDHDLRYSSSAPSLNWIMCEIGGYLMVPKGKKMNIIVQLP
jgi:hypothetical protein